MQQIKWKFIGCKHKGDGGLVKWQKHRKERTEREKEREKKRDRQRVREKERE